MPETDPSLDELLRTLMAMPHVRDLFRMDLVDYAVGRVTLGLNHRPELAHAPGWFQGTATTAIAECAAAMSGVTTAPGKDSMTLQQTIHFTGPARGERLIAVGRIVTAGHRFSTTAADVFVVRAGERHLCAILTMTMAHTDMKK